MKPNELMAKVVAWRVSTEWICQTRKDQWVVELQAMLTNATTLVVNAHGDEARADCMCSHQMFLSRSLLREDIARWADEEGAELLTQDGHIAVVFRGIVAIASASQI